MADGSRGVQVAAEAPLAVARHGSGNASQGLLAACRVFATDL